MKNVKFISGTAMIIIGLVAAYFSPGMVDAREEVEQHNFAGALISDAKVEFTKRLVKRLDSLPKKLQNDPGSIDKATKDAETNLPEDSLKAMGLGVKESRLKHWGFRAWVENVEGYPWIYVSFTYPKSDLLKQPLGPSLTTK